MSDSPTLWCTPCITEGRACEATHAVTEQDGRKYFVCEECAEAAHHAQLELQTMEEFWIEEQAQQVLAAIAEPARPMSATERAVRGFNGWPATETLRHWNYKP